MPISPFECEQMRARCEAAGAKQDGPKPRAKPSAAAIREKDLHGLILAECSRRALVTFHGSTAHRTKRTRGEPDFVILIPMGRTMLVECKTDEGRLSPEQEDILVRAALLGHRVDVVRSFPEFHRALTEALHHHFPRPMAAGPINTNTPII